jgi:prepilin-type N-terminal cleavage/methylation domain-containing protein
MEIMMDRIWRSQRDADQGFSLVELLIVIIIMGILAAVAIPMFLSQREKAQDGATKTDVELLGKELVTWFVDHNTDQVPTIKQQDGQYLMGLGTTLSATDDKIGNVSPNVKPIEGTDGSVTLLKSDGTTGGNGKDWCVGLNNDQGKIKKFFYSSVHGLQPNSCKGNSAATPAPSNS